MSSTSIAAAGLNPAAVIRAPNYVNVAVLASSVGQAFDTPAGVQVVNFKGSVDFYVKYGSTGAAVPGASLSTGGGSELNPTTRNIGSTSATTGLSLISASAGTVTMSWYV